MIQIGKGGFLRSIGTNSTIGTIRDFNRYISIGEMHNFIRRLRIIYRLFPSCLKPPFQSNCMGK